MSFICGKEIRKEMNPRPLQQALTIKPPLPPITLIRVRIRSCQNMGHIMQNIKLYI